MNLTIAIPTYNEEKILRRNVGLVVKALETFGLLEDSLVVLADNGSEDATVKMAHELTVTFPCVRVLSLAKRGKGGAIRTAWQRYPADVLCFMDADLATDLKVIPALLNAIADRADLVYGSRHAKGARVQRSWNRIFISNTRRWIVWFLFDLNDDTACGCKAISGRVVQQILPLVQDNQFFFDTELLLLARQAGFEVKEVPVEWVETRFLGRKSKVKLISTAIKDFRDLWRLRKRIRRGIDK